MPGKSIEQAWFVLCGLSYHIRCGIRVTNYIKIISLLAVVGGAMALAQCYLKESGQVIRRGRGGPLSIVNCFRLLTAVFFELVCSACTHFSKLSDMLPSMELSIDSLSDAINIGDDSSLKKKSSSVSIAEDKDKYIMRIYCVALGVQIPTRRLIEYQYLNEALILKSKMVVFGGHSTLVHQFQLCSRHGTGISHRWKSRAFSF